MSIEDKRKEMSELFAKHGLNKETLKLSQELDIMVAKEQRKKLNKWKEQVA